jgi:hypothetical protein
MSSVSVQGLKGFVMEFDTRNLRRDVKRADTVTADRAKAVSMTAFAEGPGRRNQSGGTRVQHSRGRDPTRG